MDNDILGIHHVTAIARDPQQNVDFYCGVLGLRLVKRTINFDDPGTYHLYYGDEEGRPGTILTFFPWPESRVGSRGVGQATAVTLSIPEGSLGFWMERLESKGVEYNAPVSRFGQQVIRFSDPDGLWVELLADEAAAEVEPWASGPVEKEFAIRGIHSVTLCEQGYEATAQLFESTLGLPQTKSELNRYRFKLSEGPLGASIDVLCGPDAGYGRIAAGCVHHVALRVEDGPHELAWRQKLVTAGMNVTPVLNRKYFFSIYFREPGGVLLEIASDRPGFMVDEEVDALGSRLQLPSWLEDDREQVENSLPPLSVPESSS